MTSTMTAADLLARQRHELAQLQAVADAILREAPYNLLAADHRSDVVAALVTHDIALPSTVATLLSVDQKQQAVDEVAAALRDLVERDPVIMWDDKHVSPKHYAALLIRATGNRDRASVDAMADRIDCSRRRRDGQALARRILASGKELPQRDPADRGEPAEPRPYADEMLALEQKRAREAGFEPGKSSLPHGKIGGGEAPQKRGTAR